jgi:hypothetical protein
MNLHTTPDRSRYFLVPEDAELPPGELTVRTFVGQERPGRERSVDEAAVSPYEVSEEEARAWVKEELGDVFGQVRETVLGFTERLKERTAELREENRRVWDEAAEDPELQDAADRIRGGLKDLGSALRRLAKEGMERAESAREGSPDAPSEEGEGEAGEGSERP